jgi:hypothetical protein
MLSLELSSLSLGGQPCSRNSSDDRITSAGSELTRSARSLNPWLNSCPDAATASVSSTKATGVPLGTARYQPKGKLLEFLDSL